MRRYAEPSAGPQSPPGLPGPANALILFASAVAIFLAGSAWIAFFPGVPTDLGGVPNLDRDARHVKIPVVPTESLDAWYLPGTRGATVVIFHGYGRDHTRAWRYAQFLRRAGYGVLAADFRSSGATHRKPTTLGYYEMQDARAILRWLQQDSGTRPGRIGLLGESLGGSVAVVLASEHPEIAAVVADCPFASGQRALEDAFERWAHVPRWPMTPIAGALAAGITGHDPRKLDAVAAAALLRGRPLLIIASREDDRFGPSQSRDLWQAAGARDSLWVLSNCGHNEAWLKHRAEYERRVLAFYGRALPESRAP